MYQGLVHKFTQSKELAKLLLDTKESKLVEHTKNDKYWADGGDGSGKNRLGILLMKLRDELSKGKLT
jgi:N-glycosidase YbiA